MASAQDRAGVGIQHVRVTGRQGPLAQLTGRITGPAVSGQIATSRRVMTAAEPAMPALARTVTVPVQTLGDRYSLLAHRYRQD